MVENSPPHMLACSLMARLHCLMTFGKSSLMYVIRSAPPATCSQMPLRFPASFPKSSARVRARRWALPGTVDGTKAIKSIWPSVKEP